MDDQVNTRIEAPSWNAAERQPVARAGAAGARVISPRRPQWIVLAIAVISILVAACAPGAARSTGAAAGPPQRGGTLTYLANGVTSTWPRGLDPASAGAAPSLFLSAIFGGLFQRGGDGKIQPDLAAGYTVSPDGTSLTLSLRPGVLFQDGTPLNAEAVAWNIQRDLKTPCVCSPVSSWPPLAADGITTPDDHTVVLRFSRPYAALMNVFVSTNVNRIASPTAVQKMGDQEFGLKPVGAGPFQVVSDVVSSQLVLKRYDGYFKKGQPYLDQLIFKSINGDQPTYQAIQAGQAQASTLTNPAIIKQASQNAAMTVSQQDGTSPWLIQLNTAVPPFNNQLAREAIYYATDTETIRTRLFSGLYPATQSFTGPGGLFYEPTVPGYRTYDPAKAKQIVGQLGGLTVDLFGGNDQVTSETLQVLQSEWQQAGIQTTIHSYELPRAIQELEGKKWQAALQSNGAYDPGVSSGIPFRFNSAAPYSGVHDPALDNMVNQAAATLDDKMRGQQYADIAKYISDQAYAPFLMAVAPAAVARKGVHGPGVTNKIPMESVSLIPIWDEVWVENR